jgi:uncharacterized membrane protein
MAVLFLLLALLVAAALAVVGLENTAASSATLFDRSFSQFTEGQLLVLAAALGFLVALFLFLAFGASRTRRSRRKKRRSPAAATPRAGSTSWSARTPASTRS